MKEIVEGVRCAIDLQTGMSERNVETPDNRRYHESLGNLIPADV